MRPISIPSRRVRTGKHWCAAITFAAASLAVAARAAPLPADSGILNVRDFGAKGDGVHDDTAAIARAIDAAGKDSGALFWRNHPIYFPDGTYLISKTLVRRYAVGRFAAGMLLIGQSEKGTVIRLQDHAPGFGDAGAPRPVVMTTSKLLDQSDSSIYRAKGEGNDAYDNFVEDLTIDVGKNNPGAVGLDYLANNRGAVRDVTVTATGGQGAIGISMQRKWPGPALLQNVTVDGFRTGIAVAQTEYGITFDHVALMGQSRIGLSNDGNAISAQDLTVKGAPEPIRNRSAMGLIVLDGGHIDTGLEGIKGDGTTTLLGLNAGGTERWGVLHRGTFTPHPASTFPAMLPSAPAIPRGSLSSWANVLKFRGPGEAPGDITGALRRAMASGAATIYIPYGAWTINDRITVPPTVRRIVGIEASVSASPARVPTFLRTEGEFFIAQPGPSLEIRGLSFDQTNIGNQVAVTLAANRTLILRDVVTAGDTLLDRRAEGGTVFIADACCGPVGTFHGTAPVYARQLDSEWGAPRIEDDGAPLRILGIKTEQPDTVIAARSGASVSIIGGLLYPVTPIKPDVPAFTVQNARLSAAFAEESFARQNSYGLYVAGERTVPAAGFPARRDAHLVPWLEVQPP